MDASQNGKHCSDPFTEEEKKAIEELRELVKDEETEILKDDLVLYKFLKARKFKMNQAEEMLRKHIICRKENQIDRILLDYKPVEVLEKYMSQSFLGFDKEGCPIRYCAAGNMDMRGIFKSASLPDIYRCVLHLIESDILKTKEQSPKLGKPVSQFIYIYNFENLSLLKATDKKSLDFLLLGASLFQDNYPERLKEIFILNAPLYFSIPFAIVKPVMANELINKIKIFGATGWKEELLKVIDEDVLPAFLGGKRTDPDGNPLCETFVNHGYTVPESYYITGSKEEFFSRPDVERAYVEKQSKEDVTLEVAQPRSIIEWEYGIKSKDIGFGLSYKEDMTDISEIKDLIPVHRVDPSCSTESGMYFCEKAGIYNIVFDNTYSWFTPKEVYYKISIKCPGKTTEI